MEHAREKQEGVSRREFSRRAVRVPEPADPAEGVDQGEAVNPATNHAVADHLAGGGADPA